MVRNIQNLFAPPMIRDITPPAMNWSEIYVLHVLPELLGNIHYALAADVAITGLCDVDIELHRQCITFWANLLVQDPDEVLQQLYAWIYEIYVSNNVWKRKNSSNLQSFFEDFNSRNIPGVVNPDIDQIQSFVDDEALGTYESLTLEESSYPDNKILFTAQRNAKRFFYASVATGNEDYSQTNKQYSTREQPNPITTSRTRQRLR